jgi:hypothetical protein
MVYTAITWRSNQRAASACHDPMPGFALKKYHLYTITSQAPWKWITKEKGMKAKLSFDFGTAAQMTCLSSRCVLVHLYCILWWCLSQEIYTSCMVAGMKENNANSSTTIQR